jgi:glucose-1-phosphatase
MSLSGIAADPRVLLFDVGGVLVQLSGVETMISWMGENATSDEMWRMWLHSAPVREFERGRISAAQFAAAVTAEFRLPVDPQQFLESFTGWVTGLYPGTLEMVAQIPSRYQRALLSNSNALHWTRVVDELKLGPAFGHHFVSHLTGLIKPDADAFVHVVDSLGCRPEHVLFLDDNTLNVEAAQRFGMQAVRVQGIGETRRALIERGIIEDTGLKSLHSASGFL